MKMTNVGYVRGYKMIKTLILYYLSIKPTHGYEIQKYIQINKMDEWTKIQSGSIYYALAKLEKDGLIQLQKEENIGAKVRKIYYITDKGREALKELLVEEFSRPIYNIGADKFVTYPFINGIERGVLLETVKEHVLELKQKKRETMKWQELKVSDVSLGIEKVSFEMMISMLDYQIKWHDALISEIDLCIEKSKEVSKIIENVDFSEVRNLNEIDYESNQIDIEKIKHEIINNPDDAEKILNQLIKKLKN